MRLYYFFYLEKNKEKMFPRKIKKSLKGPSFHCQKYKDQKYLWSGRTSKQPLKSIKKHDGFSTRFFDNSYFKFEKYEKDKH